MESRLVLGIDNSIDFLNLALSLEDGLLEERRIKSTLPPSQVLPGHVEQMVAAHNYTMDRLSLVAVTLGPGSFTGMRVALAFARGLATGLNIPLTGIPTLDVLAAPFAFMEQTHILPLIDAKKGEIFTALYEASKGALRNLTGYKAVKPADIAAIVKTPCVAFGTGAKLCAPHLPEGVTIIDGFSRISPKYLVREALKRDPTADPKLIYGRRSEAEIKFNVTVT